MHAVQCNSLQCVCWHARVAEPPDTAGNVAQGLNPEEAQRINSSTAGRVELLEQDGYLSVAAGRFKGYQVGVTCRR